MDTKSFSIYHDLTINASLEMVFRAVSDPEHLVDWWPLTCSGNPSVGSSYNFYFGPEFNWFGEVVKYSENEAFHIKMTDSDEDWNPTSFGFDISEENETTKIRFWHIGWPECNAHYRRSSFCWALLLQGLKDYVEKGVIIPFEERS